MTKTCWLGFAAVIGPAGAAAVAATATFAPLGSTQVVAGVDVLFDVTLAVDADPPGLFDSADVLIGSNDAADVGFTYSAAWLDAFAGGNVSAVFFDTGVYAQDVFVGGNRFDPVGAVVLLGTVRVVTTGMAPGVYEVAVDHSLDGISLLGLDGVPDPLNGVGAFTIIDGGIPTISQWGRIVAALVLLSAGTVVFGRRDAPIQGGPDGRRSGAQRGSSRRDQA